MFNLTIGLTKAVLLALWAACVLSLLSMIPEPYGQTVLILGIAILLLHFVEYLLIRSRVAAKLSGETGFIGTMVFGFAYWLPVLRSTQESQ
jgi:uncharacterized protein YhhL (DUF1145 family)